MTGIWGICRYFGFCRFFGFSGRARRTDPMATVITAAASVQGPVRISNLFPGTRCGAGGSSLQRTSPPVLRSDDPEFHRVFLTSERGHGRGNGEDRQTRTGHGIRVTVVIGKRLLNRRGHAGDGDAALISKA